MPTPARMASTRRRLGGRITYARCKALDGAQSERRNPETPIRCEDCLEQGNGSAVTRDTVRLMIGALVAHRVTHSRTRARKTQKIKH